MGCKQRYSRRSAADRNALVQQWRWLPLRAVTKLQRDPRTSQLVRRYGADDLLQEGMLVLMRAAELWDESRVKFITYALASLHRTLWDVLVKRCPTLECAQYEYPDGEPADFVDVQPSREPDPAEVAADRELLVRLRRAITFLPLAERKIVRTVLLGGVSMKDYREQICWHHPEAVRALLRRAMARLAYRLADGPEPEEHVPRRRRSRKLRQTQEVP